jgi:hypothetical protein
MGYQTVTSSTNSPSFTIHLSSNFSEVTSNPQALSEELLKNGGWILMI